MRCVVVLTKQPSSSPGHNLLVTLRKIDQEERKLKEPRSEKQLSNEVGVTFENGLEWLEKIVRYKKAAEEG